MNKIHRTNVNRLSRYIDELRSNKPKISKEIEVNELFKLMEKVGFYGVINKSGSKRAFSHELLKSNPMLVDGSFTVHIFNSKAGTIIYRDFKQYLLPHIEMVQHLLETNDLISIEE